MKKRILFVGMIGIFVLLVGMILYWLFFVSMIHLPKGEMIDSVPSPYSDCQVIVYLVNGGATVDYAIRGSVIFENGHEKTIYWNAHESNANVKWIDKDTVVINHIQINIRQEVYDYRKNLVLHGFSCKRTDKIAHTEAGVRGVFFRSTAKFLHAPFHSCKDVLYY